MDLDLEASAYLSDGVASHQVECPLSVLPQIHPLVQPLQSELRCSCGIAWSMQARLWGQLKLFSSLLSFLGGTSQHCLSHHLRSASAAFSTLGLTDILKY